MLRRSYREDGKVKQQALANLTSLPDETREIIRESLKGRTFVPLEEAIEITRSSAHGHVAAARKMAQDLGLAELICAKPCRERDLVEAMVLARLINPQTKLATTRWWHKTTLTGELGVADADELYEAMDWLVKRQDNIETKLAQHHLGAESLVFCVGKVSFQNIGSFYFLCNTFDHGSQSTQYKNVDLRNMG